MAKIWQNKGDIMKMNIGAKLLLFQAVLVVIILLLFICNAEAQTKVKVLSPSISFMVANVDKVCIDSERALLFYDDG